MGAPHGSIRSARADRDPRPGDATRRAPRISGPFRAGRGRARRLALVLLILAVSERCGGSSGSAPSAIFLRTDVEWQLESFAPASGPAVPVADPRLYTLRFGASGAVVVRADCNRCGGPYRVAGSSLAIGPLACTLAACPVPTLGEQFTAALTQVTGYAETGDELVLAYASGTLHFRARE